MRSLGRLALLAAAVGCAGGVFIPPNPVQVGTIRVRFDSIEQFHALPGASELLARSGITPATGATPPALAGDYAAEGEVSHDDFAPGDEGTPIAQVLGFFDQDSTGIGFAFDGRLGAFADGPGSTARAIVTGAADEFTVYFHVVAFQEHRLFGADLGCYESRIGVVHGTRLPDGSLELTIASTTTGLEGRWVAHLLGEGVTEAEMIGSMRVLALVAR
ncbi:MAG: hypothetical protein ACYTHK_00605 [Planctomycetota bacterium]|jgi:hypothetical protein